LHEARICNNFCSLCSDDTTASALLDRCGLFSSMAMAGADEGVIWTEEKNKMMAVGLGGRTDTPRAVIYHAS
jgi:hypothetical protein